MTDQNSTAETEATTPERPFLTVLKGNPTEEELGVLTAVFAAAAANAGEDEDTGPVNNWGRPADHLRPAHLAYSPTSFRNLSFY